MKKYIIGLTNDDLGEEKKYRTEEKCFQKQKKLCSEIIMKSQVSIKSSIVS